MSGEEGGEEVGRGCGGKIIEGAGFLIWLAAGGGKQCEEFKAQGHDILALRTAFEAGYERGLKRSER